MEKERGEIDGGKPSTLKTCEMIRFKYFGSKVHDRVDNFVV